MAGVVHTESEMLYIRGNVNGDATEIDYVDDKGDTHCVDISTLMEGFANCEIDLTINKISEEDTFIFDREVIPSTPVDQETEDSDDNNDDGGDEDPNTNDGDDDGDSDDGDDSGSDDTVGKIG